MNDPNPNLGKQRQGNLHDFPVEELDAAQVEYFIDIGIDDDGRIEKRFSGADTLIEIDIETTTEAVLSPLWQYHNDSVGNETENTPQPVTSFRIVGRILHSPDLSPIDISLSLSPCGVNTDQPTIDMVSDGAGNVIATTRSGDLVTIMTLTDFLDFTLRATGTDQAARESFSEAIKNLSSDYYKHLLVGFWASLAEANGNIHKKQFATQLLTGYNDGIIRRGKLVYDRYETPRYSGLKLTLEHVIEHPELDAEEAYVLEIDFNDPDEKTYIKRDGKKIVLSGVDPKSITSIRAHTKLAGKETPLDLSDHRIMGLFVDTFDEIICGADS